MRPFQCACSWRLALAAIGTFTDTFAGTNRWTLAPLSRAHVLSCGESLVATRLSKAESGRTSCRMTTPRTPALAELLKQYRLAAGLTQEELAERARISVRAISDLERGVRRTPHKETLRLLAEALALAKMIGRSSLRPCARAVEARRLPLRRRRRLLFQRASQSPSLRSLDVSARKPPSRIVLAARTMCDY